MARRLDQELVVRGLAPSRARAQTLVTEGKVSVDGRIVEKSAFKVDGEDITLSGKPEKWVSRAAKKLVHALDRFGLTPQGIAADIGASTGGFTQVLLAHGASQVIAIDVGHGQMDPAVAADPRVTLRERVNARHMTVGDLPRLDWVVCDVSFISLTKALGPALAAVRPGGQAVCLVKPQFEVGRTQVGKGGVVRSSMARDRAVQTIENWIMHQGWLVQGVVQSPIAGGDGNIEYLLAAQRT